MRRDGSVRGAAKAGSVKREAAEPGSRQNWRASNMLYPVPAVLVGCRDKEGKDNLMTAAWAGTICSDPVMVSVSIRKERFSHHIIEETGEFTISLTTRSLARAADYCGVRSGSSDIQSAGRRRDPGLQAGVVRNAPRAEITLGKHNKYRLSEAVVCR